MPVQNARQDPKEDFGFVPPFDISPSGRYGVRFYVGQTTLARKNYIASKPVPYLNFPYGYQIHRDYDTLFYHGIHGHRTLTLAPATAYNSTFVNTI